MTATERVRVGEWVLDPDRFSLIRGADEQAIGAQNMALLQYLAAHPNELITREVLLQTVWRGVIVNDNTLSKAVAELRKALGDESRQARYIVTVPRRGYRLIAPVTSAGAPSAGTQLIPDQILPDARGAGGSNSVAQKRWFIAIAVTVVAVLISARWWWPAAQDNTAHERLRELVPFTSEPGLELQPSFSPDGRWIAYVAYPTGGNTGAIQLKAVDGVRTITVPVSDGLAESPVWSPDGNYLAYLLRMGNHCHVHLIRLAQDTREVLENKAVSPCAPSGGLTLASLQWSPDSRELWFRKQRDGHTPLVRFDWRSGAEQIVADIYPYVFALHPRGDKLAYAEPGTMSTTLSVLDLTNGVKTPVQTRAEIFFGLAWDPKEGGLISTRSLVGGQLEYLTLDGKRRLLLPSADSLIEPAFSADGERLAVVQVRMTYDLWHVQLPARDSQALSATAVSGSAMPGQPLIQSNRFDYSPRFSHSGQRLAFLSTRSGAPNVWLANADGSDQRQAFTLPTSALPTHLRWSPDDRYLLLGASDLATYRFDFVSGQLQRLSPEDFATLNPTWSHDGKSIYVSRQSGDNWFIWRLELASNNWQPVANLTGAMAEESADGTSLYLLRHGDEGRHGVWRYDLQNGEDVQLLPRIERRNWQNFSVTDRGFHFLQETEGMLTIHTWDAERGVSAILPLMSAQDAGPLFVDFAVAPDQRRIVYTLLADFESDIMLLR